MIKRILQQVKQQRQQHQPKQRQIKADATRKNNSSLLPYKVITPEIKRPVVSTGKKLSTYFNLKDQSKFEHQYDVAYYADCSNEKCR